MTSRYKNLFQQRTWVKHTLSIILLFFLWLFLTFWYIIIFDQSVLVISYGHGKDSFAKFTNHKILRGELVSGQFVAIDDNLGIVALRFQSSQRVPYEQEDSLLFRLKEKGTSQWYYENTYRSGFIYDLPFLPFGFPIIHNSKGKTYEFTLTSLKGNENNAVALSDRSPVLTSKYQEDKSSLLRNPEEFVIFAIKKFVNSFQTIDIAFSSFIFLLPLFFYLIWNSKLNKYFPKYSLTIFLLGTIIVDIIFLQILNDLLYIIIPIIWLSLMMVYKFGSIYSFLVGIFFLLFSPLFLQLNNPSIAEQSSAFAFVFLVMGLLQAILEVKCK